MKNDSDFCEMAKIFGKWLNYVGNDLDLWEMAQICGQMTELFDKRLNNVGNASEILEMAKIFGKWLRYMGHGFSI